MESEKRAVLAGIQIAIAQSLVVELLVSDPANQALDEIFEALKRAQGLLDCVTTIESGGAGHADAPPA